MSDSRKRNNTIILVSLVVYVFLYFVFVFRQMPNYSNICNTIFILILTIVAYFMYGFQHCELNDIRKKVLIRTGILILIYYLVINLLGIYTGFLRNAYSQNILSMLKNIILPLIFVVSLEVFRYIFVSSNKDSKETMIYFTLAIILFDIAFNFYSIQGTLATVFVYLTVKVLPLIFKNIVLNFLAYQVGYHSCLLYVIPMCLYKFMIPYIPNLGNYVTAVFNITLPSIIYIYTSKLISENFEEDKHKKLKLLITIPVSIVLIVIVSLTSGIFKYRFIGVNTSAVDEVKKGDLLLINKIDYDDYEVDDLFVYEIDGKIVIDKISKKDKDTKGYTRLYMVAAYSTKGEKTHKVIEKDTILGKYNDYKISKIGYLTIWFNEFIKGDVHEN